MAFVSAREYNVEGAPSTPIGIDPLAGKPILREDLNNAAYEQLVQQYIAAGMPEEKARRLAANQVKMYGPQGSLGLANEHAEDPAGVESAAAAMAADDARHDQMQDDYNRATGLGPASPELQAQFDSSERHAREQGRVIRAGLHPQQPVDPGTPAQQDRWNQFLEDNPDEMRRYRPQVAAERDAAARDSETQRLYANIRAKYGDEEAAAWLEARQSGDAYVPLTAHQQSMNATRQADQLAAARGDADARDRLNAADARYTQNVSVPRWIREAGLNPDDPKVQEMTPGELRLRANNARQADKKSRELQWRVQVMMNAGNFAGALALVGQDPVMQSAILNQQNAALNARRPGGPINFGPNPLGVQAIGAQNAFQLLRSAEIGQGLNGAAGAAASAQDFQRRQAAAQYADKVWAARPWNTRTSAARDRLVADIDARFGPGMGVVAQGLEVNDTPEAKDARREHGSTGIPDAGPAPPGWPLGRPWPPGRE